MYLVDLGVQMSELAGVKVHFNKGFETRNAMPHFETILAGVTTIPSEQAYNLGLHLSNANTM